MQSFGDKLYQRVNDARSNLFQQGEVAQLTYQSFERYIQFINEHPEDEIEITYPVGYKADNTAINATHKYTKDYLIKRYQYLGLTQLPINGLYQLVTTVEALFADIIRDTLIEFPLKISNKRKLDYELVLEAQSLEEIKIHLVNTVINELAYKSPKDFAEEFHKLIGVNLLEKPSFHKFIEVKATRDIYIHNQGIANEIYTTKADTLARVEAGFFLPIDIQYFLQSYECCLQITEFLEVALHKIWPSLEYQKNKTQDVEEEKNAAIEEAIEEAIIDEAKKDVKPKPKSKNIKK